MALEPLGKATGTPLEISAHYQKWAEVLDFTTAEGILARREAVENAKLAGDLKLVEELHGRYVAEIQSLGRGADWEE